MDLPRRRLWCCTLLQIACLLQLAYTSARPIPTPVSRLDHQSLAVVCTSQDTAALPVELLQAIARNHPVLAHLRPVESVARFFGRCQKGTKDLIGNTKELGSLRKRKKAGEPLDYREYSLMQRTSADLAKVVGLVIFTVSKPELAPFIISFLPQLSPSTFLLLDEKFARAKQASFQRMRSVIGHLSDLQRDILIPKNQNNERARHFRTIVRILKALDRGHEYSLKDIGTALFTPESRYIKRKGEQADLAEISRPFLVSVANSIGMFNRFVPAFALRPMLTGYLNKIAEADEVLFQTDIAKMSTEDLIDACSQRALSTAQSDAHLRQSLRTYLRTIDRPPVPYQITTTKVGGDSVEGGTSETLLLNENNLRFALLGLNMATSIREAQENVGLRALFGR